MKNPLTRFRNWLTTEGPGHTECPEVDIRAHRSNARMIRWIGYIFTALLILSYYVGPQAEPLSLALAVLVVLGSTQYVDMAFRLEALEWEVELAKGENNE